MADNYTPQVKTILIEQRLHLRATGEGRSRNLAKPDQQATLHGRQLY